MNRGGRKGTGEKTERRDVLAEARAVTERTKKLRMESAALALSSTALREANQRFADVYDFVPIPYLIVSNIGVILHINESGVRFLGGEREWIVGRPLIAYLRAADMLALFDVLAASDEASRSIEVNLRANDGMRAVRIVTRKSSLSDSAANVHIAIVDLSEHRRLEGERLRAEKESRDSLEAEKVARAASEAKDEFLAMLSHELRTPLTPILAAVDSLTAHDVLPDSVRERMDIIRRNVKAETRLIDDLLDVARITTRRLSVERQPIDVHEIVAGVAEPLRPMLAERRIELSVSLGAGEHWVNGDAGRLAQVLRNILGNAAKFSDAGGRIEVASENRQDFLRISVTDTGAGMTEEQVHNLFKPFLHSTPQASRGGLGLGLVISYAIVQGHDGDLWITSNGPGRGTTVRLELPVIPAPAPAADEASEINPGLISAPETNPGLISGAATAGNQSGIDFPEGAVKPTVLLVEDDPDSAQMLSMLLAFEGFDVKTAASLYEARKLADCCELIVSDIALPDGSGLELMCELKQKSGMRGIALSGFGSAQDIEKSRAAGFEEHLVKPVDLDQLVAAVRRLTPQE